MSDEDQIDLRLERKPNQTWQAEYFDGTEWKPLNAVVDMDWIVPADPAPPVSRSPRERFRSWLFVRRSRLCELRLILRELRWWRP